MNGALNPGREIMCRGAEGGGVVTGTLRAVFTFETRVKRGAELKGRMLFPAGG